MKYILLANSNIVDFLISIMQQFNFNWNAYNEHFKEMMLNLLQSNESSDVMLVCEDKTKFKAHKFVLNACSPVFQSIISDLPQRDPIIFLRGIQSQEIKSILQFMYLGQATFFHDRMNDFLNVAKSLEIKEISKDVDFDNTEQLQEKECEQNFKTDDGHEIENISNSNNFVEDTSNNVVEEEQINNKIRSYRNEANQYPCEKCDKHFTNRQNLYRHFKSAHMGVKYPCDDCEFKGTTRKDLERHIQSVHNGIKFPCDLCEYKATQMSHLNKHKKNRH